MRGFDPQLFQRQKQAAKKRFAEGGMIRGPGTGTSDDIQDEMRPGTFIMPADSTQAMGLDEGEPDADDGAVPVRVSNGEYEMTPEMVQQIGAAVLGVVKDVTHEPVGTARGFKPRSAAPAFANGGAVEPGFGARGLAGLKAMIPKVEAMGYGQSQQAPGAPPQGSRSVADLKAVIPQMEAMGYKQELPSARGFTTARNRAAEPQVFADGGSVRRPSGFDINGWAQQQEQQRAASTQASQAAGQAAMAQGEAVAQEAADAKRLSSSTPSPTAAPAGGSTAAALGATPSLANDAQAKSDRAKLGAAWDTVKDVNDDAGRAILDVATMVPRGLAGAYDSAVVRPMRAAGIDAGYLSQRLVPDGVDPASMTPFTDQKRMAQSAAAPAPVSASAGAGRGVVNPPAANPSAPVPAAPAPSMVQGNAALASAAPRNGGQISTQNMTAASNLARGFEPGRSSPPLDNPTRGFAPAGVSSPVVRHSGNDWAARNDLRNLEVSASSIKNRPEWQSGSSTQTWSTRGGTGAADPDGKIAAYQAALKQDIGMRGAQANMDEATMRENAGLQRERIQQMGATERTGIQETGANQRTQGQLGVQQGELEMRRTAQGFQTRAAAQQEQLRGVLTDPNSSPAARAEAQRALQAINGKGESWKAVALQGGTDAQGNKTESILGAVNERTGEMKRMDGQQGQGAQRAAPQVGAVEGGFRFKGGDPGNPASWQKV